MLGRGGADPQPCPPWSCGQGPCRYTARADGAAIRDQGAPQTSHRGGDAARVPVSLTPLFSVGRRLDGTQMAVRDLALSHGIKVGKNTYSSFQAALWVPFSVSRGGGPAYPSRDRGHTWRRVDGVPTFIVTQSLCVVGSFLAV